MSPVTVGIDIGTTAVKGLAVDDQGRALARVRLPHRLRVPAADRLEHDAVRVWRDAPRRVLARLSATRPVAASVAAMVPSLAAVSRSGRPVSAGLLYGDARGRTNGHVPGSFTGEAVGFLNHLAAGHPNAAGYWPAQAVANHALCGRAALGLSTALSAYPLFDGERWRPPPGVLARQLPEVLPDGTAAGAHQGVLVDAGCVDALAEQLVSGAEQDGDVLVICGASLVVWAVLPAWREVPGLWTVPHTVPGKFLVGGSTFAGGVFLDWARRLLRRGGPPPQPADVPVWAPYPRGERTPLHDPARRAALCELSLVHGAPALWRAAYEASAFVVRHHLELAQVSAHRLVATGGGVRNRAWVQALADGTGLPVDVTTVPEGAARGAAFAARVAAGLAGQLTDAAGWAGVAQRVLPDPRWAAATAQRYSRFRELTGGGVASGG